MSNRRVEMAEAALLARPAVCLVNQRSELPHKHPADQLPAIEALFLQTTLDIARGSALAALGQFKSTFDRRGIRGWHVRFLQRPPKYNRQKNP
jgi:hypothetical protein